MKNHDVNPIIRQCKLSNILSGIANAAQQGGFGAIRNIAEFEILQEKNL
jgi:hypothetical protein